MLVENLIPHPRTKVKMKVYLNLIVEIEMNFDVRNLDLTSV